MFTANYDMLKKIRFRGFSTSNSVKPFPIAITDTSGTLRGQSSSSGVDPEFCPFSDVGVWLTYPRTDKIPTAQQGGDQTTTGYTPVYGVYFGAGTTPATESDYTLESPITSGLKSTSGGLIFKENADGSQLWECSYILQNTSDADITINEIGIITPIGKSSTVYYPVLMERTVLSSPINIPAGVAKLVTYKITTNF